MDGYLVLRHGRRLDVALTEVIGIGATATCSRGHTRISAEMAAPIDAENEIYFGCLRLLVDQR